MRLNLTLFSCNRFFPVMLVVLFCSLVADSSFAVEPDKTIVLGVTAPALKSKQVQFSERIYSDIFDELGYELKLEVLPSIRLPIQTKTGSIDGELIRMSNYGKMHRHLTRVDEPSFEFFVAVYGHDKSLNVDSWVDLKGLNVGYRRGVKVIENELTKVLDEKDLVQLTDVSRALRLLSLERLDAYIGIESLTDEYITSQSERIKLSIFKVSRLKEDSAHLFLGERFSFLAPKISAALKNMKLSGRYDEIKNQPKSD